jgi:hypothetical protein
VLTSRERDVISMLLPAEGIRMVGEQMFLRMCENVLPAAGE